MKASAGIWLAMAVLGLALEAPGQERKESLSPAKLPPKISKALEEAVPGGKVVSVLVEMEGENPGQYDCVVQADGKAFDVEVSKEGVLLDIEERTALAGKKSSAGWRGPFDLSGCDLAATGKSGYSVLVPGHRWVLESKTEKMVISTLQETREIAGVETRVVEIRTEKPGESAQVARHYHAICEKHGELYCFGKEVEIAGRTVRVLKEGSWNAGQRKSGAGLCLPGEPIEGDRFLRAVSPKSFERAEILGIEVQLKTPAGSFRNCVELEITSRQDPKLRRREIYAPGVGPVQFGELMLTSHSAPEAER